MPVVRVSWFEGKDNAQKQKVAAEITESIVRNTATDPNYIYVIFEDVNKDGVIDGLDRIRTQKTDIPTFQGGLPGR